MRRLILEYSAWFVPLCLLVGVGYAFILYTARPLWSKRMNNLLFMFRALVVSVLALLLLGPLLKYTSYLEKPPSVVVLVDNSESVGLIKEDNQALTIDTIKQIGTRLETAGYNVHYRDLDNHEWNEEISWTAQTSDLTTALRKVNAEFEGQNLAHIILVSDGLYNTGLSPLYFPTHVPISTIGVGDTIQHADVALKTLQYNKVTYEGNRFPLRVEVVANQMPGIPVVITVSHGGKEIARQIHNTGTKQWFQVNFEIEASESGLQYYQVRVLPVKNEHNPTNNTATAFVDVVKGKKRIVLIAPAPHPDIRALQEVVLKNPNYEFVPIITSLSKTNLEDEMKEPPALIVIHNAYEYNRQWVNRIKTVQAANPTTPLLIMLSDRAFLQQLSDDFPVRFEQQGGTDEITPILNDQYLNFSFPENAAGIVSRYPPVIVPFGKFNTPAGADILFSQRIGNVDAGKPWMFSFEHNSRKVAISLGNGFWKWRLSEYAQTEKTEIFDTIFGKLIQYLSSQEDKRQFRCFPLRSEYNEGESVEMETQVYNSLYELTYGNSIDLVLQGTQGKDKRFRFVTSPGASHYKIGGLQEGVYTFVAQTSIKGKREEVRGQFSVRSQQLERQVLTADFNLLRQLAVQTEGHFYDGSPGSSVSANMLPVPPASLSEDNSFHPLIDWKWLFFWLLTVIALEWFVRKYSGGY